jgi:D-sedoheptulose 7-phosphate isomerase
MKEYLKRQIKDSCETKQAIYGDDQLLTEIERSIRAIIKSYQNDGKVLVAGNGGSAADAQHIAGELVSRFYFDRPGLAALALTTDTSIMTAIGNDYGYERIFRRQIEANGRKGDVFIGISTSGNSANIVEALQLCKELGIVTIGLTGSKEGKMDAFCDYLIKVPSAETPRIQESHMVIYHGICAAVEESIFGKGDFN